MRVRGVLETCLYAGDLEGAERFYAGVLGLEAFQRAAGRHVFFRCGESAVFLVFNPAKTREPDLRLGVPAHGAEGAGHAAFAVRAGELDAWRARLRGLGGEIQKENESLQSSEQSHSQNVIKHSRNTTTTVILCVLPLPPLISFFF